MKLSFEFPGTRLRTTGVLLISIAFAAVAALAQSPQAKIMPLGDSVTRGTNDINYPNGSIPGGYRKELGYRLANAGLAFDYVGANSDNAYPGMDPDHNGNNGFRTDQMLANLSAWLAVSPDIVLLHAGTNDILQNVPVSTAASNLGSLINTITTNAPTRRLYVATIIPIQQDWLGRTAAYLNGNANSYNVQVRGLVTQYANLGRKVFLVEMNGGVVLNDPDPAKRFYQPGDGIHPGQAGYNQMAAIWFNAVSASGSLFDPPPANTPNAPTSLEASISSGTQVDLTWLDNSLDETAVKLYQKTGVNGAWQQIATLGGDVTSFSVTGLANGANAYFFAVRATNASGDSDWSNVAPSIPANLAQFKPASASSDSGAAYVASNANNNNPATLWLAASNDTAATWSVDLSGNFRIEEVQVTARQDIDQVAARRNFQVRASNDPAFSTYSVIATQGSTPIAHTGTLVVPVTLSTPFRYVRLVKTDGAIFSLGEVKVFGSVPLPASEAPSGLAVTNVGGSNISLSWTDNSPEETGFKLERKIGAGGTYAEIADLPSNTDSFTDTGLTAETYYVYRLRSTNGVSDSSYTAEASAITEILTDYESWAARYPPFLDLPSPDQLPAADPNGDGTANLLAYAFNVDPLAPLPPGALPVLLVNNSTGAAAFQFRRSKTAILQFQVLVSTDLSSGGWQVLSQAGATISAISGDPSAEWVTVPLAGAGGKIFARLRVVQD